MQGARYPASMIVWASALTLGLVGSLHCVGMCGPIALALPRSTEQRRAAFWTGRLLYNLGRTVTYTVLGIIAGALGRSLHVAGLQQGLSIACGILILIYLLTRVLGHWRWPGDILLPRMVAPLQRALARRLGTGSLPGLFSIGLLNGLLPCGLVYVALAGAAATGNLLHGALFMATFGLGTTPLLFAVALAGPTLQARLRGHLQWLIPTGLALLATLLILRGLNLGIPYVSPHMDHGSKSGETPACCSGH